MTGQGVPNICLLPPKGWLCTRPRGHTGPCAAKPIREQGKSRYQPQPVPDDGLIRGHAATHVWIDEARKMLDDAPVPTENRMVWPDSFSSGGGGDFGGGGSSGSWE